MSAPLRATAPRTLRPRALVALLLVGLPLALAGCKGEEVDPLEAARQQQAGGSYQASIEPLREFLEEHPDHGEANFLYGRALAATQPNLALWSLRKAMEDPEWTLRAGTQLAYLALAGEDFKEVYKIADRVLAVAPDNVPMLMARAQALAHSKQQPERALAEGRRVLELDPDAVEAYEPIILAHLSLEQHEEARAALEEAGRRLVELEREDGILAWHCATTAIFQQESGELEQALETWSRCLEAHPSDPDVVSNAMQFYDAHGEREQSLEVVRAALEGDPTSSEYRAALANRLHASGDTAGGEAVLREATRSEDPRQAAGAWLSLAKFRQTLGEYGPAADALERAVELLREQDSATPQLLFEYADALLLADRLDRALEVAEEITVPAHRALIRGRVAQERRDPAGALQEFDEALRLWPDNPWARYYAALAAEELGDFERALSEYRDSVRIQPSATDARTRAAALLLAGGNPSGASLMLTAAGEGAPLEIEGQLLAIRSASQRGDRVAVAEQLAQFEASSPARAGHALAEGAEGLAQRAGAGLAVDMLAEAPVDYQDPRYAPALLVLVRFAHQADLTDESWETIRATLASQPDSGAFQAIHGLDLELSGAPVEETRAAYERALELEPRSAGALLGLGRLAVAEDPEAALGFFDRAAAVDPGDPEPKLLAARVLVAGSKPAQAAERLDALLLAHPFEAEAATERARLDLERGTLTPRTLERARRAVRFGGGAEALELLSRVYEQRGEPELAAQAAEQARTLRERQAS